MKILNVVYSLGKGGTERAAQNFAFGYAELGQESRVLFTRVDGPRRGYLQQRQIPVYALGCAEDREAIRGWGPDIIHLHSHGLEPAEFEAIKSLAPGARFVETNVFSRPSPWAADLAVSYQLSGWCLWRFQRFSQGAFPAAVVPYPVDIAAFSPAAPERRTAFRAGLGLSPEDIVLGRVGQRLDSKWSVALIDVFERLRKNDPRLRLVIVNAPDSILARVAASRFRDDIKAIDVIHGDDELAVCYSAMDLFVLIAEQGESFGMVLAESMLCETPVVALATPWADNSQGEVVGHGIGGLVAVRKGQVAPLLRQLINDPALRETLGRRGRERIARRYGAAVVAGQSLAVIEAGAGMVAVEDPLALLQHGRGCVDPASRWLLRGQGTQRLLGFSLGYKPLRLLPRKLASAALNRLLRRSERAGLLRQGGRG